MPGRCEPGTGEINYPAVARALAEAGYTGVVGLEAFASGDDDRGAGAVPGGVHPRLRRRARRTSLDQRRSRSAATTRGVPGSSMRLTRSSMATEPKQVDALADAGELDQVEPGDLRVVVADHADVVGHAEARGTRRRPSHPPRPGRWRPRPRSGVGTSRAILEAGLLARPRGRRRRDDLARLEPELVHHRRGRPWRGPWPSGCAAGDVHDVAVAQRGEVLEDQVRAAWCSSVVTTSTPAMRRRRDRSRTVGQEVGEAAQLLGRHQRAEQGQPGHPVLEEGPDQRGLLGGRAGAGRHQQVEAGLLGRGRE